MHAADITPDVQALLLEHIETHEQLEAVLLLRGAPERSWTAIAVAEKLGVSLSTTEEALAHLVLQGLVTVTDGPEPSFEYQPATAELLSRMDQLAQAYRDHWLGVVKLISANAMARIRNSVLHAFTDAFLVGRKKDSDG